MRNCRVCWSDQYRRCPFRTAGHGCCRGASRPQSDPLGNYLAIREELRLYDDSLAARPELVAVTKCELPESGPIADQLEAEIGHPVLRLSAVTGKGLPDLVNRVFDMLRELAETAREAESLTAS